MSTNSLKHSPQIFTYSNRLFDRFYLHQIYPQTNFITPNKENWVDQFPSVKSKYFPISQTGIDFGLKSFSTAKVLKHPNFSQLVKKLDINNLLIYKPAAKIEAIAKTNNLNLLANSYQIFQTVENKVSVREKFGAKLPFPEFEITRAQQLFQDSSYSHFKDKFGSFVIQHEAKSGGKGTYFIKALPDYKQALQELKNSESRVVISDYIAAESASIQACVSKLGIIKTSLQKQLVGTKQAANLDGKFVGGQWSQKDYSPALHKKAQTITQKTGELLQSLGYKGIFGIDFLVDHGRQKIYIVEINARITGMTPLINLIQANLKQTPLILHHIQEHANIDYQLKPAQLTQPNYQDISQSEISYLILSNVHDSKVMVTNKIKPGIYEYNEQTNQIKHLKYSYDLSAFTSKKQFMLADIHNLHQEINPGKRIVRLIFNRPITKPKSSSLNQEAVQIIDLVKQHFFTKS